MTTLRDVAALAGVSAMTVSNVVNGREHKVSPATRERVRGAIETLGYVPNAQARTLAGSSSRIIALVYGAGDGLPALTASHESAFVGACECAARRAGYSLMLCGAHSDRPDEVVDRLRAWRVCGVICLGTVPPPVHPRLTRAEAPVVLVDSYSPQMVAAGGEVLGSVNIDDAGGARRVGERLARLGHRRVAFIGPVGLGSPVVEARLNGLKDGLLAGAAGGGAVDAPEVIGAEVNFASGVRAGTELGGRVTAAGSGERSVTGVLASGDVLAMGVVAGLRRAGARVPEDVSVVGFDGFEVSTYCDPPLTAVAQSVDDKAAQAVALVSATGDDAGRPNGPGTGNADGPGPARVVLPVVWREGGTLGPAPGADS